MTLEGLSWNEERGGSRRLEVSETAHKKLSGTKAADKGCRDESMCTHRACARIRRAFEAFELVVLRRESHMPYVTA